MTMIFPDLKTMMVHLGLVFLTMRAGNLFLLNLEF